MPESFDMGAQASKRLAAHRILCMESGPTTDGKRPSNLILTGWGGNALSVYHLCWPSLTSHDSLIIVSELEWIE